MNKKNNLSAREAALKSLIRLEKESRFSNLEADTVLEKYDFEPNEKGLYTKLLYGVIEKKITLDYIIELFSAKKISSLDTEVVQALRLGIYQLLFLTKIPQSAAVNESVNLVKKYKKSAAPFVNAILRRVTREKDTIKYPQRDINKYLSVKYSVSEHICGLFVRGYGKDETESMLSFLNEPPTMTLRTNTLKISRDELINRLCSRGIPAEKTRYSNSGIKLLENVPISELMELSEGLCYVQDEASQICAEVLGAQSGEKVIDTCACPGGKSFGIALNMNNNGTVLSFDLHKSKLSLVEKGAGNLGISIIKTAVKDGTVYDERLCESADRILCDLPCSGLGVIAKKPEIRYKDAESIKKLPELQLQILNNSAKYLKKGGVIVYSTCTLNRSENEEVVEKFLASNTDFERVDFEIGELKSKDGMLTLLPHKHGTDGFFIAKFRKKLK